MVKWLLSFASWLAKHCSLPRLVFKHRPWGPSTALLRSGPRAQLRVRPKGDWAQRRLLCQDPRQEQEDPRSTITSDGHGKPQTCSTSETILLHLLRPPRAQVLPCARETCETKAVADASIERP